MSVQIKAKFTRVLRRMALLGATAFLGNVAAAQANLTAMVPAKFKTAPVVVGMTATMPPVGSVDPATSEVVGIEAELARAVGRKLGVKVEIHNVAWDGLLASLPTGRFDLAASGITDTVARQQTMDFVDWYQSGAKLMVLKGNPKKVSGPESMCGLTLGAARATTFYRAMEAMAAKCGAKQTPVVATESTPAGLLLIKSGRVDVLAVDGLASIVYVKTNVDMDVLPGAQQNMTIRGAAFAKNNTALRDAWQAGLKAIIASGEYDEILNRFDASESAYKLATINAGTQ
jgi:polar amino acid transport system substrate-binding protein